MGGAHGSTRSLHCDFLQYRQQFSTVNGIPGKGGSIDGPGPIVAGGMVYTNSGYSFPWEAAGNLLLAFSVDGN